MPTNKHIIAGKNEENVAQEIVTKYLPYWPLFLMALLAGAGIAFTYLRYTTPVYEANATIIIKDEKKGNEDSKMMESLDLISSKKIVENEIEILQSRTLMANVVKALSLYAPVFESGKVHAMPAYITSPLTIVSLLPDSLNEFPKINFSYNRKNETVLLNNKYTYSINQIVNTPYGILKFVINKQHNDTDTANKQFYFSLI
ncbi:MAG: Wzz/FepE/Etk N-terminal domain-containing protein, partial [Ginsengibacter sp.]